MLYDLTAIDERMRTHREGQPASDFTVVYHLLSFDRNEYVRIKVALADELACRCRRITDLWPAANWYEREVWDMFGIVFDGHPHLQRILMPPTWKGIRCARTIRRAPRRWGRSSCSEEKEDGRAGGAALPPRRLGHEAQPRRQPISCFSTSVRSIRAPTACCASCLQLDGEEIVDAVPDIGFHHRGAEKMGERQSWHTYIPYTDRVDYLGGVMNNLRVPDWRSRSWPASRCRRARR